MWVVNAAAPFRHVMWICEGMVLEVGHRALIMAYAIFQAHLGPPWKPEVFVRASAWPPPPVAVFVSGGACLRVSAAAPGTAQPSICQKPHPSLLLTLRVVMLAVVPDHLPNSLVVARTLWAWVQWVQQVLRVEASWPLRPLPLLTLVPVVDLAFVVVPVGYWSEQACLIAPVLLVI